METIFYHRQCLTSAGRTVYVLFGVSIVLCWLPAISARLLHGFFGGISFDLPFALSITLFFGGMLLLTLSTELRKSSFIVARDVIIHKTPYRVTVIRFDEVASFTCRYNFLRGRPAELRAGEKRIRLGFTISRLAALLGVIEARLGVYGRGSVIDHRRIATFKRQARIADLLFEKTLRGAVSFFVHAALFVIAGSLIAGQIWPVGPIAQIMWTLTTMLFVVVWLLFFFTLFIAERLRMRPTNRFAIAVRSIDTTWLAGAVTLVLYMAYGIWFRNWVMH
jgi:hypothetical protein